MRFQLGLHCVGLWHTHPEPLPQPSPDDKALAREHAKSARGQWTGLILAIVVTRPMPAGLKVWVDDGEELWPAEPCQGTRANSSSTSRLGKSRCIPWVTGC
ncbi:MAG: Mov34/MPN/PAD-1 family protein [Paucibacter sp.]|nr:Mov34/MPN/PAD-1 family protein [Roseateles sp.]